MPTQHSIIRINLNDDDVAFRRKCNENFLALQDFTRQLSLSDVDTEIRKISDPIAEELREEITHVEENFTSEINKINERIDDLDIEMFGVAYPIGCTIFTYTPKDSEITDPRLNTGTWQLVKFEDDALPEGCQIYRRIN